MGEIRVSAELLAGQRLMVGFEGNQETPELAHYIEKFMVGGVILFSRNIESPAQLNELCSNIQKRARARGLPPLFIAIDQEGGVVSRLKEPFTMFPGAPFIQSDLDAKMFADTTARELKRVGLNMNMAPVMDIAPEGFDSVMKDRMFGRDPQWASRMGSVVIECLQKGGVMAVAKHFPGIGRTTLDSHMDLPCLEIDPNDLREFDLIPFKAAIDKKVAGVMLSHIRYEKIDYEWPASLSSAIASGMLRKELGFDGLVMTDDLDMGAIERHFDIETSVDRTFGADVDIVLICHQSPKIEKAYQTLLKLIKGGNAARKKAEECLDRILSYKRLYT